MSGFSWRIFTFLPLILVQELIELAFSIEFMPSQISIN